MALSNVNSPRGFSLLRAGGKTEPVRRERPATGAIAVGDAYTLDGNGNATRASAGDAVAGIVEGFKVANKSGGTTESIDYLASAATGYIIGIEDASAEFVVQGDTFAVSNRGDSFNLTDAVPDATLRRSRQSLNVSGGAGTQFKAITELDSPADNSVGSYCKVVVKCLQTI